MDDKDSMRILRQLDEGTGWEQSGDVLRANDADEEDDDDGMAGVPSPPNLYPITGGATAEVDSMDGPESPENILNTVRDLVKNGVAEDVLVVVNTKDGQQLLMTTLNRNDHIIGMLSVATMNWHSSQIASLNFYDDEEEGI